METEIMRPGLDGRSPLAGDAPALTHDVDQIKSIARERAPTGSGVCLANRGGW